MEDITGLQLGAFEYTTVQAMRRLGLAKVDAGDARVRELIREKSQIVNDMTEQWFVPVEGQPLLTGRESAVLPMPNMIPLLEVLNLRVINRGYDDATGFDLPRVEYVIQPRYIELVNIVFKRATVYSSLSSDVDPTGSSRVTRGVGQVFSPVPQAIKITGAFGWLEERKVTKFATTTTADIVGGTSTSVVLASVTGLAVRDVLVFGAYGAVDQQRAIVQAIDTANRAVSFDTLEADVASGAAVRAYGKVPRQIERAVQDLVFLDKTPPYTPGTFAQRNQPYDPTSHFAEKRLEVGSGASPPNGIGTGSLKVDLVLSGFTAPPFPRFI